MKVSLICEVKIGEHLLFTKEHFSSEHFNILFLSILYNPFSCLPHSLHNIHGEVVTEDPVSNI